MSPSDSPKHDVPVRGRGERSLESGASFAEIMVVLAIVAFAAVMAVGTFTHRRSALVATAGLARSTIGQAHFLSVYRAVNHFVVIDPDARTFEVYEDSGTTPDSFDNADPRVSRVGWSGSVDLELPSGGSLTDPLLETPLTQAWSLPLPDTSARWGTRLRGVMVTPLGRILSAEATPQPIGTGTVVFHDERTGTAALGVNGRAGAVLPFRREGGSWQRL